MGIASEVIDTSVTERSKVNQAQSVSNTPSQPCSPSLHSSPPPPPPYSNPIAQIIQSVGSLLITVSRDTLVIVMLFASLFGVGYILYKQTEVVEHNTAVITEMKDVLKQIAKYHEDE